MMAKRSSTTQIQKKNELKFMWGLSTAVDSCHGRRLNSYDLVFPVKCYVTDHHHHHGGVVRSVKNEKRSHKRERKKNNGGGGGVHHHHHHCRILSNYFQSFPSQIQEGKSSSIVDRAFLAECVSEHDRYTGLFQLVDSVVATRRGSAKPRAVRNERVNCGCSSMAASKSSRSVSFGGMKKKLMDAFLGIKTKDSKSQQKELSRSKTTSVKQQEFEAKRQLSLRLKKSIPSSVEAEEESITTLNHILFPPRSEARRSYPHGWRPGKMVAENIRSGEGPSSSTGSSSSTDDGVDNHQIRHESPVSVLEPFFAENGFSPPRISLEKRSALQKRLQPLELDFEDFSLESSSSSSWGGDDQSHLSHYVDLVMQASRFNWNNLSEMKSSPSEELLPDSIFDQVEDSLRCRCCFSFSRKLLFDHINEVLMGMYRSHFSCIHMTSNRKIITSTSLAGAVMDQIMAHSDFYLLPHQTERRRGLDLIVSEDVAEYRSWFDSQIHIEKVVNEVSEDILEECFTDMLREFVM